MKWKHKSATSPPPLTKKRREVGVQSLTPIKHMFSCGLTTTAYELKALQT
jgi:hypothetical protein